MIEAIIRKKRFDDVKEVLLEVDIEWFSYHDVRRYRQDATGTGLPRRGVRYQLFRTHHAHHCGTLSLFKTLLRWYGRHTCRESRNRAI